MLAAVGCAERGIVVSRLGNTRGLIGGKGAARALVICVALMYGAVVHATHKSYGRRVFRQIEFQYSHRFFSIFSAVRR